MDKVANRREAELTWWHENTHCIYESLKIPNKESYGRAVLDWISREHVDTYEVIMSVYKGDERLSEAVAMFVEHTIKKYGAEVFLKSNFGGNNKLSILAELIQKSFKYGTRQINREGKERDILRQTIYGGASNEGELSRVGKDTARPGIRQTENGGGTGGVQKEVLGEVLPGKKGFDAIAYAQQKVAEQEE
jgi:hypothetical protein